MKEYELKIDANELHILSKALGKLTYDEVAMLINKLQIQINQQDNNEISN